MTPYASLAARLLRRIRGGGEETDAPAALDPARLAPVARLALVQQRRRRMFRRVALGGATVAVAAAVTLALGHWPSSKPGLVANDSLPVSHPFSILSAQPGRDDVRLAAGGPTLASGITLQAPPGAPVRIGSADGTVLTLEAHGELAVVEQSATRRFSLRQGAVRAQVAHLQAGERLLIATDDAEVEVHGTAFRVSLADSDPACEGGRRTRVAVTEGVVSVRAGRHETLIAAGDSWPACARPEAPAEPGSAATGVTSPSAGPARPPAPAPSGAHHRVRDLPAAQTSGLAIANDLFAAAVRAEQEHHPDEALRLFSRLIEVAPDGPLAEGAAAQRMKLLAVGDPGAARRAARDYLARYPGGFAREDAQRLAESGP